MKNQKYVYILKDRNNTCIMIYTSMKKAREGGIFWAESLKKYPEVSSCKLSKHIELINSNGLTVGKVERHLIF